jgi:soluble lytic murein transglycosylase-like protein
MLAGITRKTMKYLALIGGWSAALGALFAVHAWAPAISFQLDDFDVSLEYKADAAEFHLLNERSIAEILAERLDSFPKKRTPALARHLMELCEKHHFEPAFVLSLIEVESRFRTRVHSKAGAVGLMQLMPGTARFIAKANQLPYHRNSLEDPFINLTLGMAYLAYLRDKYIINEGYSAYHVLAAYNLGPAKLDQLLTRKDWKPVTTKKYYEAIRRGVPQFRYYTGSIDSEKKGV